MDEIGIGKVYPIRTFRVIGKLKLNGAVGRSLISTVTMVFLCLSVFKLPTSGLNNLSTNDLAAPNYLTIELYNSDKTQTFQSEDFEVPESLAVNSQPGFISTRIEDEESGSQYASQATNISYRKIGSRGSERDLDGLLPWDEESQIGSQKRTNNQNRVLKELNQFEQAFSESVNYLLPGASGGGDTDSNPFETALRSESNNTKPSADHSEPAVGSEDVADTKQTDTEAKGIDPGATDTPTPVPEDSGNEIYYSYLIMTEINSVPSAFRSFRRNNGSFQLENGMMVRNPMSGLVGIGSNIKRVPISEQLMTDDWNGDLVPELFRATIKPLGSLFRIQNLIGSSYQLHESSFLHLHIGSMALFNLDEDPEEEVILTFRNNPRLVVYDLTPNGLSFQRELAIPFDGTAVFKTTDNFGNTYLHVIDQTLTRSLTLLASANGSFFMGDPPSFQGSQWIQLDSSFRFNGGPTFMVLYYLDRVALIQIHYNGISIVGSFCTNPSVPQILVGDFSYSGELQTMVVP